LPPPRLAPRLAAAVGRCASEQWRAPRSQVAGSVTSRRLPSTSTTTASRSGCPVVPPVPARRSSRAGPSRQGWVEVTTRSRSIRSPPLYAAIAGPGRAARSSESIGPGARRPAADGRRGDLGMRRNSRTLWGLEALPLAVGRSTWSAQRRGSRTRARGWPSRVGAVLKPVAEVLTNPRHGRLDAHHEPATSQRWR
jgi:hypothetical protein